MRSRTEVSPTEGEMNHFNKQTEVFDPETLHILGGALDDAWLRLDRTLLNGSGDAARTVLARHIISMAKQGERNRRRLMEGALARLTL
jgi:hypothetical protein